MNAVEAALAASERAAVGRQRVVAEAGRQEFIAEMRTKVLPFVEANFPEDERVSEEQVDRSARDAERMAIRRARVSLSPEFTDLEIGELVDDGLGGDQRARADRVRRERERARRRMDEGELDGPQRAQPWVVIFDECKRIESS